MIQKCQSQCFINTGLDHTGFIIDCFTTEIKISHGEIMLDLGWIMLDVGVDYARCGGRLC